MGSAVVRGRGKRQVVHCDIVKNDRPVGNSSVHVADRSEEEGEKSPEVSEERSRYSFASGDSRKSLPSLRINGTERPTEESYSMSNLIVDGEEAHTTAALKLRLLLQQLEQGDIPCIFEMKKTLSFAADVLSKQIPIKDEEKVEFKEVEDEQVREWLSSTFSSKDKLSYSSYRGGLTPIGRFRAAANTIIIGKFIGHLYREASFTQLKYPRGMEELLQEQLDNWDFDIFRAEALSNKQPLRFVGQELFSRHDLFRRCDISSHRLDSFLTKIEAGYGRHGNPYHNAIHAADVAVTIHYLIHSLGLSAYLTELEVLAILLSAIIHDVDHPGTTNSFQIAQQSEYAMLYNDRSVLENHHLYHGFMIIKDDESNILRGLSSEKYSQVRKMMVDMVLATDMSTHFDQIKQLKLILSGQDAASQLLGADRNKLFSFLVHMADISHPGKPWEQHTEWTDRLCEEFFQQGDQERRLGRKCSPLCDRYDTNVAESQHGFIQFIVGPSYEVCGDMLEMVLSSPPPSPRSPHSDHAVVTVRPVNGFDEEHDTTHRMSCGSKLIRAWDDHLTENKRRWKLESSKKVSDQSQKIEENNRSVVRPVKDGKMKRLEPLKEQPMCNGNDDHTDPSNHTNHTDPHGNGSTFDKADHHNKRNKQEELHTISTMQTVHTHGGSEVRTVQTVELRKITSGSTAESHINEE